MWVLTLITLVNGGTSPSKFEEFYFNTKEQCIQIQKQKENEIRYGYCSWRGR